MSAINEGDQSCLILLIIKQTLELVGSSLFTFIFSQVNCRMFNFYKRRAL